MRITFISVFLSCFSLLADAQITIDWCRQAARENYPLIRQYDLIRRSENYTLSNLKRGNLPHVVLGGKVSYQSESTEFPFEVPGSGMKGLPKDQYQVTLEVSQNIWDGGAISHDKRRTKALASENERTADVSMYALRERVDNVFFGILLIDEQLKQTDLLLDNLKRNLYDVENYRLNGIANDADVDAVKVELLKTKQVRAGLSASRQSFVDMLSLLTGRELNTDETFLRPEYQPVSVNADIHRPELLLYQARKHSLSTDRDGLKSGYMPRLSLFAQGGYGSPGLDMLRDEFRAFYVIGARLTWNFGSLYTLKTDKKLIDNCMRQVDVERELFLFNTRLKMKEQEGYIETLEKQMKDDEEIIRLRTSIRKSAEAKVANGTLSVTEMLREVTEENLAMQAKALHEIELLMRQYRMKHITN